MPARAARARRALRARARFWRCEARRMHNARARHVPSSAHHAGRSLDALRARPAPPAKRDRRLNRLPAQPRHLAQRAQLKAIRAPSEAPHLSKSGGTHILDAFRGNGKAKVLPAAEARQDSPTQGGEKGAEILRWPRAAALPTVPSSRRANAAEAAAPPKRARSSMVRTRRTGARVTRPRNSLTRTM